ncbi:MAG: A/G-specific adenine glycosylase [Gammaproteobacteria bacterium]|nr:A/G-specific adenine glycosylase [Gammaproteobacteria bacterium]
MPISSTKFSYQLSFSELLLIWAKEFGRHHLPWQQNPTPYRVWLSEVMLQQTQVKTVIPYFQKFLSVLPTINDLASAQLDQVLALWSGLGYYARARNLHQCAKLIVDQYQGYFPKQINELEKLPGIGRSTAGAIASLAMKQATPILDGNCKRIYARYFMVSGHYSNAAVLKLLWQYAEQVTPIQNTAQFNQAIMDLGSMVCTRTKPLCLQDSKTCPLSSSCSAYKEQQVLNFPHKKEKKKKVNKAAVFLVLTNDDKAIYLEKRKPLGIWGGLWSFPQFDNEKDAHLWLNEQLTDFTVQKISDAKQHTFTHFQLNYHELYVKTKEKLISVNEFNSNCWQPVRDALQLGLPTPIKKTLLSLNKE